MEEKKERCIVVIANGKKYETQLDLVKDRFLAYAKKCNADFKVLKALPEFLAQNTQRDAYSWKLLIPYLYQEYTEVLFLDLDLYISDNCPDLFEMMPENIGFMARLSDRGSKKYKRAWAEYPRVLSETVQNYFENNGFPFSERCLGDINGGVLLFRPSLVAQMYKNYWESGNNTSALYGGDEPALAFLAMDKILFKPLHEKFNYEVIYAVSRPDHWISYRIWKSVFLKKAFSKIGRITGFDFYRTSIYCFLKKMVKKQEAYIVHFSGGFWDEMLYKRLAGKIEKKTFCLHKIKCCRTGEFEYQKVFDSHEFSLPLFESLTGKLDFPSYSETVPECGVYILEKGMFVMGREEAYSKDGRVLAPVTSQHKNPQIGARRKIKPELFVDGTVASLGMSGLEKNFYHFMVEFLMRWWILKNSGIEPDFYVFDTGTKENGFQRQVMKLIGIPEEKVLDCEKGKVVQVDRLICPSHINNYEESTWRGFPAFNKKWLPSWEKDCYKFILDKVQQISEKTSQNPYIYISREKAPGRHVENETELLEMLGKYGFSCISLEDYSIEQQIALFHNAKVVVAPHGAGLVNLCWCKTGTKVLELFPQYYQDPGYRIQSAVTNLEYTYLICKTEETAAEPVFDNLLVERLDLVEEWVKKSLK